MAVADLLYIAQHVTLHRGKCHGPKDVYKLSVLLPNLPDGSAIGRGLPNSVVNDSAASRNSVVAIALSFSLSTGTSVKDFLSVSRNVPPGG